MAGFAAGRSRRRRDGWWSWLASPAVDLAADPTPLLTLVAARVEAFRDELAALVAIDSGSGDTEGVDRVGAHVAERLHGLDCDVEQVPDPSGRSGAVVVGRRRTGDPDASTVLLSAHADTVFDRGDVAARPFGIEAGRAYGPGVADDKAGLVCGLTALDVLAEARWDRANILFVLSSDEEVGSPHSKIVLERMAPEADVALCLECARPGGEVVSARKGGAVLEVRLTGRSAHAGIEPEKGVHAGLAAAHATIAVQALNDPEHELTVNVGLLHAGRIANAVPESARLLVDVRAWEADRLDQAVAAVRSAIADLPVPGIQVGVDVVASFAPMERTPGTARLTRLAVGLAERLGFALDDVRTGGGGDANTLAAAGVPVLDGLGPVGGDFHAPTEWLDLASVVPRTALLAALVTA